MSTQSVLVVDDERDIRELLTITLGRMNLEVETAASVSDARKLLAERSWDLCFTDMRLPDGSGQELIELIAEKYPDTPVAMITAYGNVDAAVTALKAGAFDFVSKPVDIKMLRQLVQTALRLAGGQEASHEADAVEAAPTDHAQTPQVADRLVGNSPPIQQVRATIAKLARNQAPVYISGESGVGKELVARLIHDQGPRAVGPFVPVNCGAIPTELMESEFFGHRKGSFTGAHADKEGLFQAANGGTLFLDEVAELPLHMQVKLLRVIQEKAVRPIGGRGEISVDVRILSATHKNLMQLVEEGQFRQDLFYRINVIELHVPPLRDHQEDVPQLVKIMLKRLATDIGTEPATLTPAAMKVLADYPFPGNVRELENILERAMAMCDARTIDVSDLMLPTAGSRPALSPSAPDNNAANRDTRGQNQPLEDYISNVERDAIMQALEATRYNKTAAARKLGITFRALRYKLKKLGID
ncbi:MAG TPA: sigma-54 dependent transcriptional regulator [Oleiagrimonas sp.]|nr:sigma-54 dependent transcriptional regulator [Oleiagrimonas sp.]